MAGSPDGGNGTTLATIEAGKEPWGTGGFLRDPKLARLERIAALTSNAVTLPDEIRGRTGTVFLILLTGEELGIPPTEALRHVHVIKGKAALSAQLKHKLARKAGHFFEVVEHTDKGCKVVNACCPGQPQQTGEFTEEDAKRAGLIKAGSNYTTYPRDMYYARAISKAILHHCPEVEGASFLSVEELDDPQP